MLDTEKSWFGKQRGKLLRTLLTLTAAVLLWVAPALAKNDLLLIPAVKSPRAAGSILLDVTRAEQRLVAVGERGHVLLSDDNGLNWRQGAVPVSVTLTAVQFPTETKGWAVGHDGVVLHSRDGGENWSVQLDGVKVNQLLLAHYEKRVAAKEVELTLAAAREEESLSLALEDLRYALDDARYAMEEGGWKPFLDVWFADEMTGFVIGAYGLLFRTEDGGENWQPWGGRLDNPDGLHLNAITASGAGLFIAGEAGTLYRSMDGGLHWETLESPYAGSFFGIVSDHRGKQIVAMGLRGNAFRSIDGGESWHRIEASVQTPLSGGAILSDGRLAIASRTLLIDGAQGQAMSAAKVKAASYSALAETADGQLILVGLNGVRRVEGIDSEGEDK